MRKPNVVLALLVVSYLLFLAAVGAVLVENYTVFIGLVVIDGVSTTFATKLAADYQPPAPAWVARLGTRRAMAYLGALTTLLLIAEVIARVVTRP